MSKTPENYRHPQYPEYHAGSQTSVTKDSSSQQAFDLTVAAFNEAQIDLPRRAVHAEDEIEPDFSRISLNGMGGNFLRSYEYVLAKFAVSTNNPQLDSVARRMAARIAVVLYGKS